MIFSIIEQALIAIPLIFGAYITLSLLKLPDFSLESAYLFGAVMTYLARDLPLPLVVMSAMAGGLTVGLIVFVLNQSLKIPYLLAAIITNGLTHSLTLLVLTRSVNGFRLELPFDEITLSVIIAFLAFSSLFLLLRSQIGYCFAIYGHNAQFFDHHRIKKKFVLFLGIILAYSLAGLSGFLFALTSGVVDLTMNFGIIMLCLISLMIGRFIKIQEAPNLIIPLIGILIYFSMQQTLLRMGLNLKYFNGFQAIFIVFILILGNRKNNYTLDHLGV